VTNSDIQIDRNSKQAYRHTGVAIAVALIGAFVFHEIYRSFFQFVVGQFANYDASFGRGLGAFILVGLAPSIVGTLSGAATALHLFKRANPDGILYGTATMLVFGGILSVIANLNSENGHWFIALITIVVTALSIWVTKIYLSTHDP
jgi:hypothetical protein